MILEAWLFGVYHAYILCGWEFACVYIYIIYIYVLFIFIIIIIIIIICVCFGIPIGMNKCIEI